MGASNFGRTNLPSGIIYAFAMWYWDGHTEESYDETIELITQEISEYANIEYDGDRKVLGYENVTLWNKSSQEWECASVNVLVEHGYHEGARLDISIDDIDDDLQISKANKRRIDYAISHLESIFAKICPIKMKRVGGFSDWTSLYSKV